MKTKKKTEYIGGGTKKQNYKICENLVKLMSYQHGSFKLIL